MASVTKPADRQSINSKTLPNQNDKKNTALQITGLALCALAVLGLTLCAAFATPIFFGIFLAGKAFTTLQIATIGFMAIGFMGVILLTYIRQPREKDII